MIQTGKDCPLPKLLAATLLLSLLSLPAQAGALRVHYAAEPLPQLHVQEDEGELLLTVLGPQLLHASWGRDLQAGQPWLSPMLLPLTPEPVTARWTAGTQQLQAGDFLIQIEPGCWQLSLKTAPAQTLGRFCRQALSRARVKLGWTSSAYDYILGLGQQLAEHAQEPSWKGLQRRSGNAMGNAMPWSSIGASGDTQVPLAYVLGAGQTPYAAFFDTPHKLNFDFSAPEWTVEANHGQLGMLLFPGQSLDGLRRRYLQLSGRPPVPPLKAFGLWLSEYGFDNWQELDDKLASLRGHGFPIDGAVLDLQWFGGISSGSPETAMGRLSWDTQAFPQARERIAAHAREGLQLMLIEESYIGAGLPEHAQLASQRLLAMDCLPPCTEPVLLDSNPWWGVGGMLDWSNPASGRWWHDNKRAALIDDGVLGHWTDLGEPEQYNEAAVYSGIDFAGRTLRRHKDVHNWYNLFWSRSIAEETARTHPQRRPWILSRSGSAGSQRYGVAMWSGDVYSSFAALQAQLRAQSNMSVSGFDYYGSDVGGFHRNQIRRAKLNQLYTRWLLSSSLMDVPLRPHALNLCNCTETAPDRLGDRASNLAALQLRYQLTPYLYSLAHAAWEEGEAVFPPLGLHFEQEPGALAQSGSKMMGPWLLFAPPATEADTLDVWLPRGRWTDFYQPQTVLEGQNRAVPQPLLRDGLLRAPLFLRAGAIVPMLRTPPAHLGVLKAGEIRWFADMLLRLVPDASSSRFVLVEDDGISRAYEQGQRVRTEMRLQGQAGGGWQFQLRPLDAGGPSGRRQLTLQVAGTPPVDARVHVNGRLLPQIDASASASGIAGWHASPGGLTLHLGEWASSEILEVQLQGPGQR